MAGRVIQWTLLLALLGLFAAMAAANWGSAPILFVLPNGQTDAVRLPVLLGLAWLAGWLPMFLWHVIVRIRLRRRLARLGDNGTAATSEQPSRAGAAPAMSQPTIVPPAGA
ncbi:hypothetical protein [Sandarakinorhabdus sp.]|uniref:hypothetical protein n=1 Tax=Sandarakinorhabdus sp. TaxID=1916663 RepID=UPI00286E7FB0|nr:hypothetical protein [Sandarakinorhabdus sp.]